MKKKFVTLLAFVMLLVTTSFANGTDVSKNVLTSFSSTFAKATDVSWEKTDSYYKASFRINGQSLNAFLSEAGEIIGISRNIISSELPIGLQTSLYKKSLNKNGSTYWISDLFEYTSGDETKYYLTVENADQKTILQSVGTYDWSLFKTTAK
jgi:hypothetical protein